MTDLVTVPRNPTEAMLRCADEDYMTAVSVAGGSGRPSVLAEYFWERMIAAAPKNEVDNAVPVHSEACIVYAIRCRRGGTGLSPVEVEHIDFVKFCRSDESGSVVREAMRRGNVLVNVVRIGDPEELVRLLHPGLVNQWRLMGKKARGGGQSDCE